MNLMKSITIIFAFLGVLFTSCSTGNDPNNNASSGIVFNSNLTYGTMTDQDGISYKTIQIGTQTWMAENLRTTKYNDDSAIANITDKTVWSTLSTGAYCNVNNTLVNDSILLFGRYYNWYAVNTGKLAPAGWHLPTYAELTTLSTYLGQTTAGGKMKETGTLHWKADNTGATNECGFTAEPGGYIGATGSFESVGMGAYFWIKDAYGSQTAWDIYLFYNTAVLTRNFNYKNSGFSVRCIKD